MTCQDCISNTNVEEIGIDDTASTLSVTNSSTRKVISNLVSRNSRLKFRSPTIIHDNSSTISIFSACFVINSNEAPVLKL